VGKVKTFSDPNLRKISTIPFFMVYKNDFQIFPFLCKYQKARAPATTTAPTMSHVDMLVSPEDGTRAPFGAYGLATAAP
jgi:hypothetical protein